MIESPASQMTPGEIEHPSRWRQLLKWGLSHGIPDSRFLLAGPAHAGVCLTFDDGPHPEHTPRLLNLLDILGIKATFFVVGKSAALYPEIVFAAAAAGHVIGNHTWSHAEPSTVSAREFGDEVDRTNDLIREITGQPATFFRPPKGKLTVAKLISLWRRDQCVVLWNRDPRDYLATRRDEVRDRLRNSPMECGDIVLLHDSHPHGLSALPDYVNRARKRGLAFETPDMWTARRGLSHADPTPNEMTFSNSR